MMIDNKISGRAFLGITKDEWENELKISFGGILTLYCLQKEIKGNNLRKDVCVLNIISYLSSSLSVAT